MSGSFMDLGTPVMVPASFLCPKSAARWPVGVDRRVPQSATPKPTQGSSSGSSPRPMHFASSLHLLVSHHESSAHARCFFPEHYFLWCLRECITSFPHRLRYFIFRSLRCVSSLQGVGQREGGGNQGKRRGRKRRVKTERKGGMFSELCSVMLPSVFPPDL